MTTMTTLSPLTALPFIGLLLTIAILPLAAERFWSSNRNKGMMAVAFSIPVIVWFGHHHPSALLHSLEEYLSFIILLGSLYIISGGIAVMGDLRGTPVVNTTFLALGAILANVIGTTGASMLFIRPFLRTNSERHKTHHLPIFFIILVSNCGGMLTPLGDPPLFIGFLRGVPFFWTLSLFPIWCLTMVVLLTTFFLWDRRAYSQETSQAIRADERDIKPLRVQGLINLAFLAGVVAAAFVASPRREIIMIFMASLSLLLGPRAARHHNRFTWHPIIEVAVLFAGIFITMVPALMLLKEHGAAFGITKPWHFFWVTGILSSFLDNAPTYATALSLAQGLSLPGDIIGVPTNILKAISVGAVCMGANSYIGNGPNFMVKAFADHHGFRTPSFFAYMFFAAILLVPLYIAVTFIFFA